MHVVSIMSVKHLSDSIWLHRSISKETKMSHFELKGTVFSVQISTEWMTHSQGYFSGIFNSNSHNHVVFICKKGKKPICLNRLSIRHWILTKVGSYKFQRGPVKPNLPLKEVCHRWIWISMFMLCDLDIRKQTIEEF